MGRCCVLQCKNRRDDKNEDLSYHRFPKKTNVRDLWSILTGRRNSSPTPNARICSKQYEFHYFRKTTARIYLHPDTIPTLFIPLPERDTSTAVEQPIIGAISKIKELQPREMTFREFETACEQSGACSHIIGLLKTRCVRECVSPSCYREIYQADPLEEGEIDVRLNSFKGCFIQRTGRTRN